MSVNLRERVSYMAALIFVILATIAGVYIGFLVSDGDATWLDYYRGGVIGLFISGVILYALNEKRRLKELRKKK